jgi:hypothetical protein
LARQQEAAPMAKPSNPKRKKVPKTDLKLPDLELSKSAVLNSLVSSSSQRSYDHAIREFIEWYCSEPRLAFNKTVVTRYRIALEQKHYAPSTINLRLAAVRRLDYEASDSGLLSPDLAVESAVSKESAVSELRSVIGSRLKRAGVCYRVLATRLCDSVGIMQCSQFWQAVVCVGQKQQH